MRGRVFATRLGAWLFSRAVSKHMGFPRCDCPTHNPAGAKHNGSGHPPCPCPAADQPVFTCPYVTRRYMHVVRRPDGLFFAYVVDAVIDALQGTIVNLGADGQVTIDTTTAVALDDAVWRAGVEEDP